MKHTNQSQYWDALIDRLCDTGDKKFTKLIGSANRAALQATLSPVATLAHIVEANLSAFHNEPLRIVIDGVQSPLDLLMLDDGGIFRLLPLCFATPMTAPVNIVMRVTGPVVARVGRFRDIINRAVHRGVDVNLACIERPSHDQVEYALGGPPHLIINYRLFGPALEEPFWPGRWIAAGIPYVACDLTPVTAMAPEYALNAMSYGISVPMASNPFALPLPAPAGVIHHFAAVWSQVKPIATQDVMGLKTSALVDATLRQCLQHGDPLMDVCTVRADGSIGLFKGVEVSVDGVITGAYPVPFAITLSPARFDRLRQLCQASLKERVGGACELLALVQNLIDQSGGA